MPAKRQKSCPHQKAEIGVLKWLPVHLFPIGGPLLSCCLSVALPFWPVSAITVTLINSLKPKGTILGKPKSLTSILEDMGYSNGTIKEMAASEAWATMLSGKTTPQERILPPTPEQENLKLVQDEIAVTENSLAMMQERIKQMVTARASSTEILQLKLSVSELQGKLTALREEESIELARGIRLLPPPQAIDKLQLDLENVNAEIEALQTVIPIHEEAVATMKAGGETTQLLVERAKLNELEVQLTVLGEQKGQLTRFIAKLEGPAVIKPVVPGHATTLDPNLPIQSASELAVSKGLLSLTEYATKTADKRAAYVSRYNELLKQEAAALESNDEAAYAKVTKEIRQIEIPLRS